LQTIHDFARHQLLAAGEADSLRDGHAAHFLPLTEALNAQLEQALNLETLQSLEDEHDNLRAALQWLLDQNDAGAALRLVSALALFWATHGHFAESLSWYRKVLATVPPDASRVRAHAVWGLGHLGLYSMDLPGGYGTAETEQAVTLARQLNDPVLLGRALADQGMLLAFAAPEVGMSTLEQAVAAARRADDDWTLATALSFLAFAWIFHRDRPDLAEPLLDELAGIAARSGSLYWRAWHSLLVGIARGRVGRLGEARVALEAVSESSWELSDPLLESWSAAFLTEVLIWTGDYDRTEAVVARSLAWHVRSAFARAEWMQFRLAITALTRGDFTEVHHHLDAVTPTFVQCGIPFIMEEACVLRSRLALEEGDLASARSACEEASAIATNLGSSWQMVEVHRARGRLARVEGDAAAAEDLHHRSLALCIEHGFRGVATETLEALASLATGGESWAEASRLFGAAAALRDATGQVRWPLDQPAYDADLARLQDSLGAEAFEKAWHEGLALSMEEAAAYASRARGERKRPSTGWAALTPTELEVAALATQGLTNAQIGSKLFITAGTAKIHLSNIYRKLGVANRAQLAVQATARGIAS
ncbi:MAG: LuxR C-terminal-related transcriptional regulator, partial [Acidimicrobiia bacterium]